MVEALVSDRIAEPQRARTLGALRGVEAGKGGDAGTPSKPGGHHRSLIRWRNIALRRVVLPVIFPTNGGERVLDHEWKNLIILDDCRVDAFSKAWREFGFKGTLRECVTRGTDTRSFLLENFAGAYHSDVVYVTANPNVSTVVPDRFFKIIPVWRNGWNDEYDTVLPETMYEYALDASRRFPDKRLIIHFLQPHIPFIDLPEDARNSFRVLPDVLRKPQANASKTSSDTESPFSVYLPPWDSNWYLFELSLGNERIRELYQRNLSHALPYVKKLLDELPGKSVVTSDHGEAIGEPLHPLIPFRVYGHPPGVRMKCLTRVPWFVSVPSTQGPHGPPDLPAHGDETEHEVDDEKVVEERLRSLGYV